MSLAEGLRRNLRDHILEPWFSRSLDPQGGFRQEFSHDWTPLPEAGRGIVFQARHVYTAATAARTQGDPDGRLTALAEHGLNFISERLIDPACGLPSWRLDAEGRPDMGPKHAYGIAFCIYGLAALARTRSSRADEAGHLAESVFSAYDEAAWDEEHGGWHECLSSAGDPFRELEPGASPLSWPGARTLNSHLHLLEALAELVQATGSGLAQERLARLSGLIKGRLIVPVGAEGAILHELFAPDWTPLPAPASYGHSVETGMVLALAARALGEPVDFEIMQKLLRQSLRAAGRSGAILDFGSALAASPGRFDWWPQAELLLPRAMLSLDRADAPEADWPETWSWIDRFMIDREHGGWHTAVGLDLASARQPKGGFWTEPYHQARAVIGALAIAEGGSAAELPL